MGKNKLPIIVQTPQPGFIYSLTYATVGEFLECLLHGRPLAIRSRWTDFLLHSRRSGDDLCPSTWV